MGNAFSLIPGIEVMYTNTAQPHTVSLKRFQLFGLLVLRNGSSLLETLLLEALLLLETLRRSLLEALLLRLLEALLRLLEALLRLLEALLGLLEALLLEALLLLESLLGCLLETLLRGLLESLLGLLEALLLEALLLEALLRLLEFLLRGRLNRGAASGADCRFGGEERIATRTIHFAFLSYVVEIMKWLFGVSPSNQVKRISTISQICMVHSAVISNTCRPIFFIFRCCPVK